MKKKSFIKKYWWIFLVVLIIITIFIYVKSFNNSKINEDDAKIDVDCLMKCNDAVNFELMRIKTSCLATFTIPSNISQEEIFANPEYNKEVYCNKLSYIKSSHIYSDCINFCGVN